MINILFNIIITKTEVHHSYLLNKIFYLFLLLLLSSSLYSFSADKASLNKTKRRTHSCVSENLTEYLVSGVSLSCCFYGKNEF
jgi:hypothetical protein